MKRVIAYFAGFLTAGVILFAGITQAANPVTQVVNGGTGWGLPGGIQAHSVLVGNGKNPIATTSPGNSGQVLTSNGAGADPTFQPATGGAPGGSSGQLQYNGSGSFAGVATTSVTCSGNTTCATFTVLGPSPITISSTGGSSTGLSTTTPLSAGNLLAYSATGAGSAYGTATSTLNATSPLTGSFTQVGSGGALGIQVANTSQNGYLSSTDWNTFNGKVSSQWTGTSPGSIYYQTGNVGIGTSSPYAALSVSTTTQESGATLFAVASSTNATLFNVLGNGNVGINAPSFFSFNRSTLTPQLQLNGIDNNNGISIINHTASNIGANLVLGKTSGTTAGTFSALSNGNTISRIFFTGSVNSTDASTTAAIILATVDGTPTATTLPGSLAFQTTQAGSTGTPVTRMTISNAGDVGINSTPQYYAKLYVSTATTTLTNGPATIVTGLTTVMNQTPASASSATIFGQYNTAQWAGSADSSASGSLTGAQFGANLSGAASLNSITGLVNQTVGGGSGTIVTAMGGQYNVSEQGGGTITNAYAGIFNNNSSGAGSVITNSKGLWVAGTSVSGGGSIVNNEGLYVDDQSGGTNNVNFYTGPAGVYATGNYALYNNSAYNNYFKGNTGVGSTTPGSLLSIGNSGWNFYDNATSTKSGTGGINITDGCYAKNGVCIPSSGGSGTNYWSLSGANTLLNNGTRAQFPLFDATSTTGTSTITSSLAIGSGVNNTYLSVGTTSPAAGYARNYLADFTGNFNDFASINVNNNTPGTCSTADLTATNDVGTVSSNFADLGHTSSAFTGSGCSNNPFTGFGSNSTYIFDPNGNMDFALASTSDASFRWFTGGYANANRKMTLANNGFLGIGTSTPGSLLSLQGIVNFTTATSSFYSTGGLDLQGGGCFSISGTCLQTFIQNATAYKSAANYATVAVLAGTPTYNNGSSGVGATLTEVGTGALSVDGASPATGNRILVKNQADQTQDGVFTVTATGSGIASYILTRATDFNTSNDIYAGVTVPILSGGTTNGGTSWVQTTTGTIAVGSSNIVFAESSVGTGVGVTSIATNNGITGGTITTTGTIGLAAIAANSVLGNLTGASAVPTALATSSLFTFPWSVTNGGTGSTTLSGILIGNGTSVVNSLTIGSGLLLTGTTLSASAVTPNTFTLYSSTAETTTNAVSTTTLVTVGIPANTINGTTKTLRVKVQYAGDNATACTYGVDFGTGAASTTVGFDRLLNRGVLDLDMTATSTSVQGWESVGFSNELPRSKFEKINGGGGSSVFLGQASTVMDLTAKTYLGFNAVIITGAVSCNIEGITVEVVTK